MVTIQKMSFIFLRINKSNRKLWKSVYKLCSDINSMQSCICKINHSNWSQIWANTSNATKYWPFIYVVDLWHWLQFEYVIFSLDLLTENGEKVRLDVQYGRFGQPKRRKETGNFEWEIEKRERNTENALNCGHQVKTKALVRKIKWSDFLKPQIKISNIVHFKDLVHSAKFKLVVIWYRSCEPNWFSWSANIYTCMAFYTNL